MTERDQVALGMLALTHAKKRIDTVLPDLRVQANALLKKKERVAVEIDGETVGMITKSSPSKVARVNDGVKLLAWMREHYPEHVERVAFVENMEKVFRVLMDHAPELVLHRDRVSEAVERSMLADSVKVGVPVGPGGEADVPGIVVDTPDGNTSAIPDKQNAYLIDQLFAQGRVSLDGTVRREIEGSSDGR
jgi:hypothetical protein